MDYRPQRSWIGNARGWLSKAGYGGSDVTFNNSYLLIVSSQCEVVRVILSLFIGVD